MLMDERSALDAATKAGLQGRVAPGARSTRTSFVFITHDIEEVSLPGDRGGVPNGSPGRIEQIVTIDLPVRATRY
jgi:ABC-type nitrate/sulfonate/bicarbonate transport system ATPase subunit